MAIPSMLKTPPNLWDEEIKHDRVSSPHHKLEGRPFLHPINTGGRVFASRLLFISL
jgi:hypothetical protein